MTASQQIDAKLASLPAWQAERIAEFRSMVMAANPNVQEAWKWGTGMWTLQGKLICGFGAFKQHVKLNFMQGAALADPAKLFNNGFEAKASRSIDIREGEMVDMAALRELVAQAVHGME